MNWKNFSYSTVATAPSPATSGTSLIVASGEGSNFTPFQQATIWPTGVLPTTSNSEIVLITAVSSDTLTITRAQSGTAARSVVVGDQISGSITSDLLIQLSYGPSLFVNQSSHGFSVGNAIRHNGSSFVKAQADSAANAEVSGIVSEVSDSNNFTYKTAGRITGLSSLTAGTVYFLDPVTAGALTATEPTTAGQISKPLLIATSTTAGDFFNMRGAVIESGGAGGGLWSDWDTYSSNQPIAGVTVGNGTLVGRWWTPMAVFDATEDLYFMCHYSIYFALGSTSSVDSTIYLNVPIDVYGISGRVIVPVNGVHPPLVAQAYEGGVNAVGIVEFVGGSIQGVDGVVWDAGAPVAWGENAVLRLEGSFYARFGND